MTDNTGDPMARKRQADVAIDAAAAQLRQLLLDATAQLEPFPPFPGAFFTYGIEIEGCAAENPERGCIVLGSDGELYELEISVDLTQSDDPVTARDEKLTKIELHPRDYIPYAYNALTRVTELLMEQAGQ